MRQIIQTHLPEALKGVLWVPSQTKAEKILLCEFVPCVQWQVCRLESTAEWKKPSQMAGEQDGFVLGWRLEAGSPFLSPYPCGTLWKGALSTSKLNSSPEFTFQNAHQWLPVPCDTWISDFFFSSRILIFLKTAICHLLVALKKKKKTRAICYFCSILTSRQLNVWPFSGE